MKKTLPYISIVICSYNGQKTLADCLKAVKLQKWNGGLEIIVVDDGSTDDTYKIARSFKGIRVISNEHNIGLSASRNIGINAAQGEIIAFTDDDCKPSKSWIAQLYKGYTKDMILGVGGVVRSTDKSKFMNRYLMLNNPLKPLEYSVIEKKSNLKRLSLYLKGQANGKNTTNRKRPVYSFVGANMSFRKKTLVESGKFDEAFTFGGDDQEISRRINKMHPKSLHLAPRASVTHQFDSRLKDTLRRSKAYGIGNARLTRKYAEMGHTIYPFPVLIVLSLLLVLITPWLLLTPLVLIQILYPKGLKELSKQPRPELILYCYVQFLQEVYNNIGYIKGWFKFRKTFKLPEQTASTATVRIIEPEQKYVQKLSIWKRLQEPFTVLALLIGAPATNLIKSTTVFHIPAAIVIVLTSGYILLRASGAYQRSRLPVMLRYGLMTALGIFWLMLVGLFADVVLPIYGVTHPLTSNWVYLVFVVTTALLIPWSLKPKAPKAEVKKSDRNWENWILYGILGLTLFFSFIGARLLNNGYSNVPAITAFGLGFIAIIFTIARQKHLSKNAFPLVLFLVSVASVWSYSLRSNYVFGFDIQQEYQVFQTALTSGHWALGARHGAYSSMLSLTILPVMVKKLSGISPLAIFNFLSPIAFSFVPVMLYYIYRQLARQWMAFVAALVVVAQFYYMQQFSGEVRQQIAFLFFATILYMLIQKRFTSRAKNTLLLAFIMGLVVSHYSTTYLAIIFFVGTYLATRAAIVIRAKRKTIKAAAKQAYIKGWMVLTICLAAAVWYIPATHSYGNIQSPTTTSNYGQIFKNIYEDFTSESSTTIKVPETTPQYLKSVGNYYHSVRPYFTYYQSASNKTVTPAIVPTIKAKSSLITDAYTALYTVYSYVWWIIGSIGVAIALIWSFRSRDYKKFELTVVGVMGIAAFVAIHVFPSLQVIYNPSRLNEQVLMVIALPAVLLSIRLLGKIFTKYTRYIVALVMGIAFLMASGVVTQYVGGNPPANLNNYGVDYNSLYVQQTDTAAANWLGANYTSNSTVYADDYATNRLEVASNINHGQLIAVTPTSIAQASYVYADYTNVKDGIATSNSGSKVFNYSFPSSFLNQNKDLVYTNGDAEIYK
jgi:uncharacterized membrane protein/glycosyltransferase involved in cell wall biosynthesis